MFTSFWNTYGERIIKVLKGAAIAGCGAAITSLLTALSALDVSDPTYVAVITAVSAIIVNICRVFGVPVVTAVKSRIGM